MLLVQNPSRWSQKRARTLGWGFLLLNLLIWQRFSWAAGTADPACRAQSERGVRMKPRVHLFCIFYHLHLHCSVWYDFKDSWAGFLGGKYRWSGHAQPQHPTWEHGYVLGVTLPAVDKGLGATRGKYAQINACSLLVDLFSSHTFFPPGDKRKTSPDLHVHKGKQNHVLNSMQAILIISHCYVNYYYCCTKGL